MPGNMIEINVAVMNYDRDSKILTGSLKEIELMLHIKDKFILGETQFTFGWYFFTLSVSKEVLVKLVNLLGNEFLNMKEKSVEKKFVKWLTVKLKQLGCEMKLDLKSEIETSKYGLF